MADRFNEGEIIGRWEVLESKSFEKELFFDRLRGLHLPKMRAVERFFNEMVGALFDRAGDGDGEGGGARAVDRFKERREVFGFDKWTGSVVDEDDLLRAFE
jgi:hypothetical protein